MGYLIVAILALVLVGGLLVAVAGRGRRKAAGGTLPSDHSVSRTQPSADAPTPGASVVADPAQKEQARQKTPPA